MRRIAGMGNQKRDDTAHSISRPRRDLGRRHGHVEPSARDRQCGLVWLWEGACRACGPSESACGNPCERRSLVAAGSTAAGARWARDSVGHGPRLASRHAPPVRRSLSLASTCIGWSLTNCEPDALSPHPHIVRSQPRCSRRRLLRRPVCSGRWRPRSRPSC